MNNASFEFLKEVVHTFGSPIILLSLPILVGMPFVWYLLASVDIVRTCFVVLGGGQRFVRFSSRSAEQSGKSRDVGHAFWHHESG